MKEVHITNHLDETIRVVLNNPFDSGFNIFNLEGIGPVNAIISYSEFATSDGALFNASRLGIRNVILTIKFNPRDNESIESVRYRTYEYFAIKRRVRIRIKTETRDAYVDGYVESNEPIIFSKEEWTKVSVICTDPYFYSSKPLQETMFYGIDPLFEFKYANEGNLKATIFSQLSDRALRNIPYEGDLPIGVRMNIKCIGKIENISVHNVDTRETFKINTTKLATLMSGKGLDSGDELIITTIVGSKQALLLRNGVYYNIMNAIERGSAWFQLAKGDNVFSYTAEAGYHNATFTVTNRTIFEGM